MSDSRDRGLHSRYVGGYGYPYPSGTYINHPAQAAAGYPPIAYPPPAGYPPQPPPYPCHNHSGHGRLRAIIKAVAIYGTGHIMSHSHGGYVAHGGHYGYGHGGHHRGKFKHGKFGKHGGFRKWK